MLMYLLFIQIILPIILQDKLNLLETYVYGSEDYQQILVQYLDHLCDRDTDLEMILKYVTLYVYLYSLDVHVV